MRAKKAHFCPVAAFLRIRLAVRLRHCRANKKGKQVHFLFCIVFDLHYLCTHYYNNSMQETRQNRISRLLQKELSLIFQSQTRAMRGVMVSVTRVKISPDLSICTAYLSVFPSEKGDEILKNINANEKSIRYDLGTRVRNQLRIIPELRFFIDDSLDYIEHIDELLKK